MSWRVDDGLLLRGLLGLNVLFVDFRGDVFGVLLSLGLGLMKIDSDFSVGDNILDFIVGSKFEVINVFDGEFGIFGKLVFGDEFFLH